MTDIGFRLIPLGNSAEHFARVDTCDYEWLSGWHWSAAISRTTNTLYAYRMLPRPPYPMPRKRVYMHRLIVGLEHGRNPQCDHINRDSLDNRRVNLRIATIAQNTRNRSLFKNNSSGVTGVRFDLRRKVWVAYIRHCRRLIDLGRFADMESAVVARLEAEKKLFGEFAGKAVR